MVGLPLTTKVPVSPAAKLAPLRPTRSRLMSTRSPCLAAKLRDVAALWATISTKQANAIEAALTTSLTPRPPGSPTGGNPPVREPTTETPCCLASVAVEIRIERTTATTAPGTTGRIFSNPTIRTTVPIAKATVAPLASDRWVIVCHCCWNQLPVPFAMPSMAGTWPESTETPTPLRKPTRTVALRKLPMKPSLSSRARIRKNPQIRATMLHQASHSWLPGVSPETPSPPSPAARIAAVAESAPTTSSRDEPSSANSSVGKMIV